nr:MAG TPA: hypothetical protein [Caudoviricetes sp.]
MLIQVEAHRHSSGLFEVQSYTYIAYQTLRRYLYKY